MSAMVDTAHGASAASPSPTSRRAAKSSPNNAASAPYMVARLHTTMPKINSRLRETRSALRPSGIDRKSGVEGESESVRVDLGGGRTIKQKNHIPTISGHADSQLSDWKETRKPNAEPH